MKKKVNIAIDGPAGAGKSTVARRLSEKLGYLYVDTGAMYRAMALGCLMQDIDPEKEDLICASAERMSVSLSYEPDGQHVLLDGLDVTSRIRREEVAAAASKISTYPAVRQKLVKLQQQMAETKSVVMDGRDIGTVVLPDADLKIYLTADAGVRAARRCRELTQKGQTADPQKVKEDILARDAADKNRKESPLRQAPDAVLIDSSQMDIDQVVEAVLSCLITREKEA